MGKKKGGDFSPPVRLLQGYEASRYIPLQVVSSGAGPRARLGLIRGIGGFVGGDRHARLVHGEGTSGLAALGVFLGVHGDDHGVREGGDREKSYFRHFVVPFSS